MSDQEDTTWDDESGIDVDDEDELEDEVEDDGWGDDDEE